MKVLVATAVVAAAVSLNGDGTTTTLICCSAFIPIYKKLKMKMMNLGVLIILQNTIMNLLPWGGPTARAMAVLEVDADILTYLLPGMFLSLLYVILFVARRMGKQERARLGITELTDAEIKEMTTVSDPDMLKIRCPQNFFIQCCIDDSSHRLVSCQFFHLKYCSSTYPFVFSRNMYCFDGQLPSIERAIRTNRRKWWRCCSSSHPCFCRRNLHGLIPSSGMAPL